MIASASDKDWDGEFESQANRSQKWFIGARQHEDGRAIVYATYDYYTNWRGERDAHRKAGKLLPAGSTADDIIAAIGEVCEEIGGGHCDTNETWDRLKAECIADLPPVELE